MIYLYSYYSVVIAAAIVMAFQAYAAVGWLNKLTCGMLSVVMLSTAGIIGLIHSWTGEGFSYFGSMLQQIVAFLQTGKAI